MATLETSPEANCDRQTGRMTKPLIGARATALPKNLKEIEVITDLEEIKSMSKNSFKRLVMKKAKEYESNEDGDEAVACSNDGGIIKHPALSFIKDFFKDISTEIENLGLISVFHPK